MIFVVTDVATGRELDRVELTPTVLTYETGVAEDLVENRVDKFGRKQAMEIFRSWSNGYVSTAEI